MGKLIDKIRSGQETDGEVEEKIMVSNKEYKEALRTMKNLVSTTELLLQKTVKLQMQYAVLSTKAACMIDLETQEILLQAKKSKECANEDVVMTLKVEEMEGNQKLINNKIKTDGVNKTVLGSQNTGERYDFENYECERMKENEIRERGSETPSLLEKLKMEESEGRDDSSSSSGKEDKKSSYFYDVIPASDGNSEAGGSPTSKHESTIIFQRCAY